MRVGASESSLLAGCMTLLALRGFHPIRLNAGAAKVAGRLIRMAPDGTPDIYATVPGSGRALWVECKRPGLKGVQRKGRVRPAQRAFIGRINELGGVGLIIDDLTQLSAELDRLLAAG